MNLFLISVDPQVKRKKPAHRRASNFNVAVNLPPAAPVNIDANNKKRTSSSIDHTEKPMQYSVSIAHVKVIEKHFNVFYVDFDC
jgi:hypothetical protein